MVGQGHAECMGGADASIEDILAEFEADVPDDTPRGLLTDGERKMILSLAVDDIDMAPATRRSHQYRLEHKLKRVAEDAAFLATYHDTYSTMLTDAVCPDDHDHEASDLDIAALVSHVNYLETRIERLEAQHNINPDSITNPTQARDRAETDTTDPDTDTDTDTE